MTDTTRYLDIICGKSLATWQTFDDNDERKAEHLGKKIHGRYPFVFKQLEALQKQGAGVFLMVNEGDGKGRSIGNVTRVRAVFVDLDGSPVEPVMEFDPHLAVESSPGRYHAYWLVNDCQLDQFTPIQKALAAKFDGDNKVIDLCRVMRVPGFLHQKGEPFTTKIIYIADDLTPYNTDHLVQKLDINLSPAVAPTVVPVAGVISGVGQGGRNDALAKVAGSVIGKGMNDNDALQFCRTWNQQNVPPLPDTEVVQTVQSIAEAHRRNAKAASGEFGVASITDMRVAERFAGLFRDRVRYWPQTRKWLVFDGTRWASDLAGGAFPYLKEMIGGLYEAARKIPDDTLRQNVLKGIVGLENHRRQETVLDAATVIPDMIVNSHQLDRDPMVLNVRNGTLDLTTGALRPQNHADLITRLVDIDYAPGAQCPEFLHFLDTVLAGKQELVDYLQRFIGYCLTGKTTEQVLLFLYGTGANGKTTLANIIEALLGDFAATADCSLLMHRDNRTASNDLAALRGARLVKVSEFDDGERLAESTVKTLTGGDRVACRFLYGEFFEYTPAYKIVLLGNHKPKVRGRDLGIWRRIHLLPFRVTIAEADRDPHLLDKLLAELPGILAWAVQGCLAWQRGGLRPPAEVRDEVEAYRLGEDIFSQWLDDCCVTGDEHRTPANDLLASFVGYSNWRGTSSKKFSQLLEEAGFAKEKSNTIYWRGVALTSGTIGRIGPFFRKSSREEVIGSFTENASYPPNRPKEELPCVDVPLADLGVLR